MRERIINILALLLAVTLTAESAVPPRYERLLLPRSQAVLDTVAETERLRASLPVDDTPVCIYDMPYSINASYPNYGRLAGNSLVLVAGGILTLGILSVLPEDATAWNKKETRTVPMFQRYFDHVMHGPVIDKDNAIFNYVLHPYAGAAYYMSARSQGFNVWQSWLYSFLVSTVFWEFGVEAFMEYPSIQDLIITPMGGLVLGEAFYLAKRYIVQHDYELLGTKWLGYPVAFLLDPVNECLGYFRGNNAHGWSSRHHPESPVNFTPQIMPLRGGGVGYGFSLNVTF